jgi:hypothetical protein
MSLVFARNTVLAPTDIVGQHKHLVYGKRGCVLIVEPGNGRNRVAKIPIIAGRSLRSPSCGADNPLGS